MLEQVIDELMAFSKRRGGRLIFGPAGTVFSRGHNISIEGKASLLSAMREDREREYHKRERECHRALLHEIVHLRGADVVSHRPVLARCIDSSTRCLRELGDHDNDS